MIGPGWRVVDDSLLRAIIEDPDDDAPRLVYADWLDEHGESARAAFIRAQVKLARLPVGDPGRPALVQIERTLWRAHRDEWTAWVPEWAEANEFGRGFLEEIRCDAATFFAQADEVRLKAPLQAVRLDGRAGIAIPMFQSRALNGLRSLTLSVDVPRIAWEHLATSPYLGQLTDLDLSSRGPATEMVASLLSSTAFPSLRSLRLHSCALGDENTARLVGHPWVARLEKLDLNHNHIYVDGGQAIVASRHLAGIAQLDLSGNPLAENWAVANSLRDRFGSRVRL
jgi:uncharacterized protein (TIGR02996 family)